MGLQCAFMCSDLPALSIVGKDLCPELCDCPVNAWQHQNVAHMAFHLVRFGSGTDQKNANLFLWTDLKSSQRIHGSFHRSFSCCSCRYEIELLVRDLRIARKCSVDHDFHLSIQIDPPPCATMTLLLYLPQRQGRSWLFPPPSTAVSFALFFQYRKKRPPKKSLASDFSHRDPEFSIYSGLRDHVDILTEIFQNLLCVFRCVLKRHQPKLDLRTARMNLGPEFHQDLCQRHQGGSNPDHIPAFVSRSPRWVHSKSGAPSSDSSRLICLTTAVGVI